VGGGSSTYLLELCGIAPEILNPADESDADTGIFDDRDRIRLDRLDPLVREALWAAVALARAEQMPVSTEIIRSPSD
jgi:hypothetical protein